MQPRTLIDDLILVFKIVSIFGFLAAGAMAIGIFYKGFKKLYREKAEEAGKKWIFIAFSVLLVVTLMFMYIILF